MEAQWESKVEVTDSMGKAIRKSTMFNTVLNDRTTYHDYYCNNGSNVLDMSWNDLIYDNALLDGVGYKHIHNGVRDQQVVHEYADRLCKLSGEAYDRVFFSNSGSDAIESAIKIAKMYYHNKGDTRRQKIITAKHSFHGNTIGALTISDAVKRNGVYKDLLNKDIVIHRPIAGLGDDIDPTEILCVVLEPYQIHTTFNSHENEFNYKQLETFCKKHDLLLIMDEIYTGGGKMPNKEVKTYWGWQDKRIKHRASLVPDMIVCGKAITSGLFPLSGVVLHNRITENIESKVFEHSSTYANHGLGCAVGLFVLNHIEKNSILENNMLTCKHIEDTISVIDIHPNYEVKSNGLLISINCPTPQHASEIQKRCRDKGFVFGQTFVVPGTLLMCPHFDMSTQEVNKGIEVLTREILDYGN
jgi:adenosylmethionine-8-amino-7-oxononanoate aminotransferase